MCRILVIGSTNTDMVIKTDHMPLPGETVIGGRFFMDSGGKGANQAIAAIRLGGEVTFITKIGDDMFGHESLKKIKKEGINTDYVFINNSKPSGVALITVSNNAENSIVVAPGANNSLKKKNLKKAIEEIKSAELILIQLEIPLKIVEYVVKLGKKHGIKVILNPAPGQQIDNNIYDGLFAITPNETETEIMTGVKVIDEKSAEIAAIILKNRGVENVIITMGSKGAYLFSNEYSELIPGYQVDAVDTTAAGDTFNGALTVALSKSIGIKEAILFANRAASLTVTKLGAQSAIPHLKDIDILENIC